MFALEITIGELGPDHINYVTSISNAGLETERVERLYSAEQRTLNMPEGMARALHDALAAHFGTTSSVLGLRSDFVHERGRVDKLIDTVSKIATGEPR